MIRLFTTWLMLILLTALPLHAGAARIAIACAAAASPCHQQAAKVTATHARHDGAAHTACGSCSALCMAACMQSACLAVPAITASENVSVAVATLATGFIPDGPLRPPRHA